MEDTISTEQHAELPEYDSVNGAIGASLLQQADKRRLERERNLFLDVPSWDGDLVAEYRVVPKEELRLIAERAMRRAKNKESRAIENDMDLLATANVGLHARDPESGDRVPIEDGYGIVTYGRIAPILGKEEEIKSNSDAIRYLMAERNNDGTWQENIVAIGIHAQSVSRWMRDPSKRGTSLEDMLGEL
jgi:hypothetical protein